MGLGIQISRNGLQEFEIQCETNLFEDVQTN